MQKPVQNTFGRIHFARVPPAVAPSHEDDEGDGTQYRRAVRVLELS